MMENKKIVRLAIIRENGESSCPFGLTIPDGCSKAGKIIDKMTVIEDQDLSDEDKNAIIQANMRVLMLSEEPKCKCKYANFVFKKEEGDEEGKVECDYGDAGAGLGGAVPFGTTEPLHQYLGVSFNTVPISYYNQDLTYSDSYNAVINRYYASDESGDLEKKGNK